MENKLADNRATRLEATILATILSSKTAAHIATQELGRVWEEAFASPETSPVANAIREIMDKGKTPTWSATESKMHLNGDGTAILDAIRPYAETAAFAAERCAELRDTVKIRALDLLTTKIAHHSATMEPDELIEMAQQHISQAAAGGVRLTTAAQAAAVNWQTFLTQREHPNDIIGIPTGFRHIDLSTHGLQAGKPYVLGARPSHGKTAIADNIALAVARTARPVIIFAHEMDAPDHTLRMAAAIAQIDYNHALGGRLNTSTTTRFMAACDEVKRLPVWICDDTRATPRQLQAVCHAIAGSHGEGLVIVDYIQLERIPGYRGTRTDELAIISGQWLDTLKSTRHAGLLLSQLNRDASNRPPRLADLRDSGAIEQDAHGALLLWRPGVDDESCPANQATLWLAKNRNGSLAKSILHFEGYCMRFRDWRDHTDTELCSRDMREAETKITAAHIAR